MRCFWKQPSHLTLTYQTIQNSIGLVVVSYSSGDDSRMNP